MVFATGGIRVESGKIPEPSLSEATVSWRDVSAALKMAKGRVLVLLDACHSGHITQGVLVQNDELIERLSREHRSGALVFAAAKGRQVSLEPGGARGLSLDTTGQKLLMTDAPHGFFTAAILNALSTSNGDRNHDGTLQVSELVAETTRRVHRATGGLQTPFVARRELFGDFSLVSVWGLKKGD